MINLRANGVIDFLSVSIANQPEVLNDPGKNHTCGQLELDHPMPHPN